MESFCLQLLCKGPFPATTTAWFILANTALFSSSSVNRAQEWCWVFVGVGVLAGVKDEEPPWKASARGTFRWFILVLGVPHSRGVTAFGTVRSRWGPGHILQLNFSWDKFSYCPPSGTKWSEEAWTMRKFSSKGLSWAALKQQCTQTLPGHVVKQLPWDCSCQLDAFQWSWLGWASNRICCLTKMWRKALCGSVVSWNDEVD